MRLRKIISFVLCLALLCSLVPTAFAAQTQSIEVSPINIMVGGKEFLPTDVNGKNVPVFVYQGTTYAPLRALAEAYGLTVGYNSEKKLATVDGTPSGNFAGTKGTAQALTERTTLTVSSINIEVNGAVFQPTDVNDKPVSVFVYSGTTYAPLRALAEAYGLTVGYDGTKKLATVDFIPIETILPSKEDYLNRVLTDQQLASLKNASLDTLRASISTIGDAVAYLDQFTPHAYSGFADEIRLDVDFVFNLHTSPEATTPQTYAAFATWCITDDYNDIKYVIGTGMDNSNLRIGVALALPVKDGYAIFSPGTLSSRLKERSFAEVEVSTIEDIDENLQHFWSEPGYLQLFVADAAQRELKFIVEEDMLWAAVSTGAAELVYYLSDEQAAENKERDRQMRVKYAWSQVQANWSSYGMPAFMAPTMSRAEVEALVGKDIDTVAAACKTLGDCIYYYALSGFTGSGGDLQTYDGSIGGGNLFWHYNYAPSAVFAQNTGNCGGTSGLTSYLLQGDYAEVGMLGMTFVEGAGGGHFINYLYDGTAYYVFDAVNLLSSFHQSGFCFSRGNTLKSAANVWISQSEYPVRLMWAYQSFDGDVPVGWDWGNSYISYLPAQYKDEGKILIETPSEGYVYEWVTISDAVQEQINGLRNPGDLQPEETVPVAKGKFMARALTDEQLNTLKYADADTLQTWISTVADAVAYLDQFEQKETVDAINGFELSIDTALELHKGTVTAPDIYTFFTGWCLADDYPSSRYLVASVSNPNGPWIHHSLLIPTDGGYQLINPAQHSERWSCVFGFDECFLDSTANISGKLRPYHAGMGDDSGLFIYHLFATNVGKETVSFVLNGEYLIAFQNSDELYRISDAAIKEMEEKEKAEWDGIAKDKKVSDYGMPNAIGDTTLSYQQAYTLVGQDPEVIRSAVKTVGDVLQYMIAAQFGHDAPSAYTPWYGFWGFDAPGDVQLEQNYGCCCGGFANTVSYLLKGDYEKVGTLRWVGGGNHTISWVYTGGKYYVFDFTQYCSGGRFDNYNCPVTVLDRLEDFYDQMPDTYSYFPKSEVVIMVAFEAGDAMYPSNWSDPPNFAGLTLPVEAKGKVLVIYQKYSDAGVIFREVDGQIPGWEH